MSGFFSRWFGSSNKANEVVRVRRSHLTLEELEKRDVPATLYVTSLADTGSGPGELRTEIGLAKAGDTVEFISSLAGGTVDLAHGQLTISSSITVESAPGFGNVTIDAEKDSRIFNVSTSNTTFYVTGLTLEDGTTSGYGGGINTTSDSDELFVTNCTITDCHSGGGGGAIYAHDSLTMVGSTITDNYADKRGGGVRMNGDGTIETSTITGNKSDLVSGGGIWTSGNLYLSQSNISENTAGGDGGGLRSIGADTTLTTVNCTFYKNTSGGDGGAISIDSYGNQHLTNNTIVSNSAGGDDGGIEFHLYGTTYGYTLYGYLINDIVALNTATANPNIYGTIQANNCDIDNSTGINYLGGSGGNIFVEPDLGPLADNGGPTDTMMPMIGSPVINAGTNVGAPNVDQRGVSRPQGGRWDIGAVEVRGFGLSIVSGNFQSTPENQLFPAPLVVQISSPDLGVLVGNTITWTINTAADGATGIPETSLTVKTDSNGEASLTVLANDIVGTFTVNASTFIPFDFTGKQTVFFTLQIVDSAHTLEFAQQPLAVVAGQAQTVTILALNSQDKVALNFNGAKFPVILELIDSSGNVVQTLGTADGVDGVVTFNDIVLNTVGVGYQFKAIATELNGIGDVSYIDSISFDVNPNQPTTGRRRT